MTDPVRAVDLFCGAGGLSWGLAEACERLLDGDTPTVDGYGPPVAADGGVQTDD